MIAEEDQSNKKRYIYIQLHTFYIFGHTIIFSDIISLSPVHIAQGIVALFEKIYDGELTISLLAAKIFIIVVSIQCIM